MIICDVCKENVARHTLGTNKIVYGLMPIVVGTVGYNKEEWIDTDDGSGMTQFIHDRCLETVVCREQVIEEHDCPDYDPCYEKNWGEKE